MGVADPRLLDLVAGALAELGQERALVVHGAPGMDEISPCGATRVAELRDGRVERYETSSADLGMEEVALEGLAGGGPENNARTIQAVLAGEPGAPRTATLLNAAGAIYVAGRAATLAEGVAKAAAAVDDGSARDALERLQAATLRR
jgi:anthranilate phosphoribosyltransferase